MNKKIQSLLDRRDFFESKIEMFKQSLTQNDNQLTDQVDKIVEGRDINVCIRARPLLNFELEQGYFDIIHANHPQFHLFEPKMDFKQDPIIDSKQVYDVDYAYGPNDQNDKVYKEMAVPLIDLALKGGLATMFAYGQTGSGKTFTIQGI